MYVKKEDCSGRIFNKLMIYDMLYDMESQSAKESQEEFNSERLVGGLECWIGKRVKW